MFNLDINKISIGVFGVILIIAGLFCLFKPKKMLSLQRNDSPNHWIGKASPNAGAGSIIALGILFILVGLFFFCMMFAK